MNNIELNSVNTKGLLDFFVKDTRGKVKEITKKIAEMVHDEYFEDRIIRSGIAALAKVNQLSDEEQDEQFAFQMNDLATATAFFMIENAWKILEKALMEEILAPDYKEKMIARCKHYEKSKEKE
jgi:hypothetical protein